MTLPGPGSRPPPSYPGGAAASMEGGSGLRDAAE
jgi:hypothetical protein